MSNLFKNMTSTKKILISLFSLLVVPSLFIIVDSKNTYADVYEVDFSRPIIMRDSGSFSGSSFDFGGSFNSRIRVESFYVLGSDSVHASYSSFGCPGWYFRGIVSDSSWGSLQTSLGNPFYVYSGDVFDYVSGSSYSNPIIFAGSDSINMDGNYNYLTFSHLYVGCSPEELSNYTPTPSPTPTPTETPTPTPTETPTPTPTETPTPTPTETPDVIDPDDYEYNSVEDAIVKYRFISLIIIFGAGLLLYHVVIKRIILR